MPSVRFFLGAVVLLASALFAQPVPFINQPLIPSSVAPGSPSFTLTVNGTGFVSASKVNWNGSARATQFVSALQLKASILASDVTNATTGRISVTSPGGSSSNVVSFQVIAPAPIVQFNQSLPATATRPEFVATGDFNGDGKPDIAASSVDGNVSILLGNGDGTFQPHVDYPTASGANAIVTGDFNNDGKLDLALCNFASGTDNTGEVLLGNGDGTFQPEIKFTTGLEPIGMVAGDFNGDGKLDLATSDTGSFTVSVLLGNGDGTFQPPVSYPAGRFTWRVTTGDFNDDGKLDLAVVNNLDDTVSILLGNGDGTFQPQVTYATGDSPQPIIAADFNGDGKLDLAISNTQGNISLLLGNGDGTFQAQLLLNAIGQDIVAGDFNGDGKLDLATSIVSVLLGNGDGTFQAAMSFFPPNQPIGIAAADFNGDGMLDLVVGESTISNVTVLLQTAVALSPGSLAFPVQLLGTTSKASTITLTTSVPLTISNIVSSAQFPQTNTCGSSLPAGGSCTISVSFAPTAGGAQNGTLTISDNAPGSPQVVPLTGTGTSVSLVPRRLSFGLQKVGTSSQPMTSTLSNVGNVAVNISSIAITPAGQFTQTNTCGSSLPAHGSCTISVTFSPKSVGFHTARVAVTDDGGGSPQRIGLQGKGD